jgi:galactokinase
MQTELPADHPPQRLVDGFVETFHEQPDFFVRAPECVDLLGAPSAYNDGWVLTAATTRYVWLAVKSMPAALVSIRAIDLAEETAFRLTDLDQKSSLTGGKLPEWALYPAGVAWGLQEAGLATPGTQIAMLGESGLAADPSFLGAIASACTTGWLHITGWQIEKSRLAQLCQQALRDYAGYEGRLSDLLPAFIGKAGQVLLFDTQVLTWKSIPFPDHVTLVTVEGDPPGERSTSPGLCEAEYEQVIHALQAELSSIESLRDISQAQFDAHQHLLTNGIRRCVAYIIGENNRIHTAADALLAGDMESFGRQMSASHRDYGEFSTTPSALDLLWKIAKDQPGWLGGRASTTGPKERLVLLVKAETAEDFCSTVARQFTRATGQKVKVTIIQLSDGAQIIPLS